LADNFESRTLPANKILSVFLLQRIEKFIEATNMCVFFYKFRAEEVLKVYSCTLLMVVGSCLSTDFEIGPTNGT